MQIIYNTDQNVYRYKPSEESEKEKQKEEEGKKKQEQQKKEGKKVTIRGNPAMQADSTTEFAAGKGLSSWDDYVRMKLSQLE